MQKIQEGESMRGEIVPPLIRDFGVPHPRNFLNFGRFYVHF